MASKKAAPKGAGRKTKRVGRLLIIGGAEDRDIPYKEMKILPHFIKMAGGKRARIIVCGSSSEEPEQAEQKYVKTFRGLGAAKIFEAQILERNDAEEPELLEQLSRATGVFFTGGDQLRLTSLIAGTTFADRVHSRLMTDGLIVAGTSAGATAMSSTMVIGGSDKGTVRRCDVTVGPGLGYLQQVTIDTHFAQRGRISRMLTIFAQNPQVLGIGIDENTAIEVTPRRSLTVLGSGAVFIFDGRVSHSNAPDIGEDEVLALTHSTVHVLPAGYGFNFKTKLPTLPNGKAIRKRAQE